MNKEQKVPGVIVKGADGSLYHIPSEVVEAHKIDQTDALQAGFRVNLDDLDVGLIHEDEDINKAGLIEKTVFVAAKRSIGGGIGTVVDREENDKDVKDKHRKED